jgi:hypothetical protein
MVELTIMKKGSKFKMVKAYLTNIGRFLCEGNSLYDVMTKVEEAGFEATVYNAYDNTILSYSPIGGWRII